MSQRPTRWAAVTIISALSWSRSGRTEERAYEQREEVVVDAATPRGEPRRDTVGQPTEDVVPEIEPRRGGSNFLVVNAYDGRAGNALDEAGLVKFRVDLEYDIARLEKWESAGYFYVTFPIRLSSFWDLFDALPGSESSPFLETNYAPGLELSWVAPDGVAKFLALRTGALHESNGLGFVGAGADQLSSSRSWNMVYLGASYAPPLHGVFQAKLDLSGWLPFGSDRVVAWPNGKDAGTRLEDHIGYAELGADLQALFSPQIYPTLRMRLRQRSLDAQFRWPFKQAQVWGGASRDGNGFRLDFIAHCFVGKGERLTVANENRYSCYAGVGL